MSPTKTFLEVTINGSNPETCIPALAEIGCRGFLEQGPALVGYFGEESLRPGESAAGFRERINRAVREVSAEARVDFREVPDRDWNEEWEKSIRPIEIGERFVVRPSWAPYENRDQRIVIQIDPKMSFGTGFHESTRLMMSLLERYVQPGFSVLDVGTGTGILAIAAARLGSGRVLGIDNDDWSISNSKENIRANGLEDRIDISGTPAENLSDLSFNLLAANLTLNTISELLPRFHRLLVLNGMLLISGFLVTDREAMIGRASSARFFVVDEESENGWLAIAARRLP